MNRLINLDWVPLLDNEPNNSVANTVTNFVRKDLLRESNGKLFGNWSSSFSSACDDIFTNKYILKNSVKNITEIGNCEKGYTILMFEHY